MYWFMTFKDSSESLIFLVMSIKMKIYIEIHILWMFM